MLFRRHGSKSPPFLNVMCYNDTVSERGGYAFY